jgi:hypothetical protein
MKLFGFIIVFLIFIIIAEVLDRVIIFEYPNLAWSIFGAIFGILETIIIMY